MAQIMRKTRHLRLVGAANKKGRAARQQRHRNDQPVAGDVAYGLGNVRKTAHCPLDGGRALAKARAVRRLP
ncbi:hypothetical protein D9M73_69420 [compost metagenome]